MWSHYLDLDVRPEIALELHARVVTAVHWALQQPGATPLAVYWPTMVGRIFGLRVRLFTQSPVGADEAMRLVKPLIDAKLVTVVGAGEVPSTILRHAQVRRAKPDHKSPGHYERINRYRERKGIPTRVRVPTMDASEPVKNRLPYLRLLSATTQKVVWLHVEQTTWDGTQSQRGGIAYGLGHVVPVFDAGDSP